MTPTKSKSGGISFTRPDALPKKGPNKIETKLAANMSPAKKAAGSRPTDPEPALTTGADSAK